MGEEFPADHLVALKGEPCLQRDLRRFLPFFLAQRLEAALRQYLCVLQDGIRPESILRPGRYIPRIGHQPCRRVRVVFTFFHVLSLLLLFP